MHKTLLFINTGSGKNLGDRAMQLNMASQLKNLGAEKIWLPADMPASFRQELAAHSYPLFYHCLGRFNLDRWPRILSAFPVMLSFLACWLLLYIRKYRQRPLPFSFMEASMINALADTDCAVFNGGGYLTDKGRFECRCCLVTGWFALMLGKKVIMTGQGIGPADSYLTRFLLKRVCRQADSIMVRDPQESQQLLQTLGVAPQKIIAAGDDAFTLPAIPLQAAAPLSDKVLAVHFRISAFTENVNAAITTLQQVLLTKHQQGWHIRFFIFSEHSALEQQVIGQLTSAGLSRMDIIQTPDPRQLKAAIAECTLAIGIAYHFQVFALSCGVPVLGLYGGQYYRQKIQGLFQWFDKTAWTIPFEHFTTADALLLLDNMALNRDTLHHQLLKRSRELSAAHQQYLQQAFSFLTHTSA